MKDNKSPFYAKQVDVLVNRFYINRENGEIEKQVHKVSYNRVFVKSEPYEICSILSIVLAVLEVGTMLIIASFGDDIGFMQMVCGGLVALVPIIIGFVSSRKFDSLEAECDKINSTVLESILKGLGGFGSEYEANEYMWLQVRKFVYLRCLDKENKNDT